MLEMEPYVANSNAIQIALTGVGIEKSMQRSNGVMAPVMSPYFHPHTNPHIIIGRCIGNNLFPISCICPVKNGRIKPSARSTADVVNFFVVFIIVLFSLFLV